MFYCEACRVKNEWPRAISTGRGPCALCRREGPCHDVPVDELPDPDEQPPALPPFNPAAVCPKCGFSLASGGCRWAHQAQRPPKAPEHMSRTCERCGFYWREAPMDAKETPDE